MRTESQGRITNIYHQLGQFVPYLSDIGEFVPVYPDKEKMLKLSVDKQGRLEDDFAAVRERIKSNEADILEKKLFGT